MRHLTRTATDSETVAGSLRRRRRRLGAFVVALAALASSGLATGVALARSSATRLGAGVVVIETRLGYQDGAAAGTGMVLTSSGEILTNNHVIRSATSIKIVVPNTGRTYTAKVVGYDVKDDVAVLQASGAANLTTVTTSSTKLAIGTRVIALGNAGGSGRLISARGTITALGRSVVVGDDRGGAVRLTGMVGTNASVQPGDSGGPLLNSAGEVVGMDTAGSTGYSLRSSEATQAYAIPIAKALSTVKIVEAGHTTTRVHVGETAFLGVQVATPRRDGSASGALIVAVTSGGPAASAGLNAGDTITAINGQKITSPTPITAKLLTKEPGDPVRISYVDRVGTSRSVTATLASGPAQ